MPKQCTIPCCNRPHKCRGLCNAHYSRFLKHGFTTGTPVRPLSRSLEPRDHAERFWSKVRKTETCWLYEGLLTEYGYGVFRFGTSKHKMSAHRFAWALAERTIPDGWHLDHLCRVPACVLLDHLEPVTNAENRRRGVLGVLRTHCRNGHEATPENTIIQTGTRTYRRCRICAEKSRLRDKARQQYRRDRAHGAPL